LQLTHGLENEFWLANLRRADFKIHQLNRSSLLHLWAPIEPPCRNERGTEKSRFHQIPRDDQTRQQAIFLHQAAPQAKVTIEDKLLFEEKIDIHVRQ
jgi:hypothetical protein